MNKHNLTCAISQDRFHLAYLKIANLSFSSLRINSIGLRYEHRRAVATDNFPKTFLIPSCLESLLRSFISDSEADAVNETRASANIVAAKPAAIGVAYEVPETLSSRVTEGNF